ncbi:MAG: SDR family oxidoreductase [Proteobacteria bacterium]|nr:SDR family oxidoreductase [Pseudomonadota bacterium]
MGTVIVTGASRGIGAAISRGLAAKGHVIYAGMRRPGGRHALEGAEGDIRPVRLDVTSTSDAREAVDRALSECGRIDALVNNAGVAWFAPAEEMSETVLHTTLETNFLGAVRATQAVLPAMRAQGSGRIVMISTLAAATGLPLESAYCASKSALEAFAESLRHEVARFGIGVAVVEPGITKGGLSTSIPDPEAPEASAYEALLQHTHAYYDAAQAELESPQLVVDAVRAIVDGTAQGFRFRLGAIAPVIEEVVRAGDAEAVAMLHEALGIRWWAEGEPGPDTTGGAP